MEEYDYQEIVQRKHSMCKKEWSKDGKITTEGMMGLRSHVRLAGCRQDLELVYRIRDYRLTDEQQKEIFDIAMSYLDKAVIQYAVTDAKKESHIRLLIEYCMTYDLEFSTQRCKESLVALCRRGGTWRRYAPKALLANISKYGIYEVNSNMDPVMLYADVLVRAEMDTSQMYTQYWRHRPAICTEFVKHLFDSDFIHAGHIASIGLELFPNSTKLAAISVKVFEPSDPRLLKAYCRAYATGLDMKYYRLATSSPHWNKDWARRLAEMLAAGGRHDAELAVLHDAGLDTDILAALLHEGTADSIYQYRALADEQPDTYYEICRRLAEDIVLDGDEIESDDLKKCLHVMRNIPGHAARFNKFCRILLDLCTDDELDGTIRKAQNATTDGTK